MAGDPRYLKLLNSISKYTTVEEYSGISDWEHLDLVWSNLIKDYENVNTLNELAIISFQILARTQGVSIEKVTADAKKLHIAKNAGYAGANNPDPWANFRMATLFDSTAFKGCMIRLGDKYIRIKNLRDNPDNEQVGESIWETLRDLGAYALIGICLKMEEV